MKIQQSLDEIKDNYQALRDLAVQALQLANTLHCQEEYDCTEIAYDDAEILIESIEKKLEKL